MASNSLRKAVFLDRDGVINREVDHLARIEDIHLLPGVGQAIAELNARGYAVIVITNQSAIARGIISEDEVVALNSEIARRLAKHNAVIDAWYYCPHYSSGAIKKYAIDCLCRKPEIGMLTMAKKDFGIDMKKSFFVGDTTSDIFAGKRAGTITILVETGYGGTDKKYETHPHFIAKDLLGALSYIP